MGNTSSHKQHQSLEYDQNKAVDVIIRDDHLLSPHSDADDHSSLTPVALRRQHMEEVTANRPIPSEESFQCAEITWAILSENRDGLGTEVFVRMFESYPDLKSAFGPLRHMNKKDAGYEDVLRAHGIRVLSIVEQVLSKRHNMEEVLSILHDLGRKHLTFSAKVEYIDIVSQMFLFAIESALKEKWNNSTEKSWGEIIRFVTYVMKETMVL
ncbi:hypothetical protein CAPTEDRAFT_227018 [Capitella teleta]|uniref:Globin domain-containing protein n=1 Tax=Capitella teleta TaxID=283909 RepID=R7TLW3_CAPTE|nr:hypothetical protein CAPTEDRAFT_227018 [Capitella teleta]|eukprot:ELT94512.1 hypothetical protein CAPTEDRAFT_227018 [Capitella teleta]